MNHEAARPNVMEVNLDALEANYHLLTALVGSSTKIIASVKGAAYGLGLREIAQRLTALGVDGLATGSYADAIQLRKARIEAPLVMFGGALPEAMRAYVDAGLIPTVHNIEIAQAVSRYAKAAHGVYIKVDCGWGRLGVPVRRATDFVLSVAALPNLRLAGIYTHLPFSSAEGRDWARDRLRLFDELLGELEQAGIHIPVTQARSSAGILAGLTDRCNAVCPGGLLYGRSPLEPGLSNVRRLQPVLRTIRTRLIHVSERPTAQSDQSLSRHGNRLTGVVPFGRADGNRAPVQGRAAHVLVRGARAPVLSVSSEHCVVDLSAVPSPTIGDEVIILGRSGQHEVTLGDLAASQATTSSDVLLMMSGRMQRIFVSTPS